MTYDPDVEDVDFDAWITTLDEEVIQGEYGYERGEFEIFPGHWHPLYLKGLSPADAFKRALNAHAMERKLNTLL